jgi:hypothetical protein
MGSRLLRLRLPIPIVFLLLAALLWLPQLLGLRSFPDGDFTHHFLPFSLFQQQELLAGRLPLWNPYTYAGHPFFADAQSAALYPVSNLLLLVTLPLTDAGARLYFLQVEAVLHVALAGWFMAGLLRALTGDGRAGLVAGILFALSGYLTGYPPLQLAILRTAVWLPLIFWLLWEAMRRPRRWDCWLGAGVALATAWLAGHPQTFLFIAYMTGAWLLALLLGGRRVHVLERSHWLGLLLTGLVACGLAMAQLPASLEFTAESVRANADYAFLAGGFPLQDSWQLLLPGVLTQFSPLYVGVIGLGLALLGLVSRFHPLPTTGNNPPLPIAPPRLFFVGLALVALLLSYGDNSFLFPLFYQIAPGWQLFRGQERAAFGVAVGLAGLAGYGMAALPQLAMTARIRWGSLWLALVCTGVYVFGLFWLLPGSAPMSQPAYLLLAALTVAGALLFAILLRRPGWSERRTAILLAAAALNLLLVAWPLHAAEFGPGRRALLPPEAVALQEAVTTQPAAATGLPGRVYNEFRLYEDYGMRIGVEDVWGSSPLRLRRLSALFDEFPLDRMWRLLGVHHVLTWRAELFGPSQRLAEFPQATDTTYLHRLPAAHPRAWLATTLAPATDEEALALLADHQFDLDANATVDPLLLAAAAPMAVIQSGAGQVTMGQLQPGTLSVTLNSAGGGLLVVSENWLPGWEVIDAHCGQTSCEGAANPLPALPLLTPVRADLTLVAVPVPAGEVAFTLRYAPASVRIGLLIGGVSLLASLGLALALWLRRDWAAHRVTP